MSSLLPSLTSYPSSDTSPGSVSPDRSINNRNLSVGDLVKSAGSYLPIVRSRDLLFDKPLGSGSYSTVSREILYDRDDAQWTPYYVAVKRIPGGLRQHDFRQRCEALAREVRVTSHVGLRHHPFITPVLAYGWEDDYIGPARPFVLVEYSPHGTATQYLQRIKPDVRERRELALDVARGIQALHECGIIHGDLNPSNIIITDTKHMTRVQKARVADFGVAVFEVDAGGTSYLGTPLYNAPEIQCTGHCSKHQTASAKSYYAADIYSLGLTVWTIMGCGQPFISATVDASPLALLDHLYHSEVDGLLARSQRFCQTVVFTEAQDLAEVIRQTFVLSIRETPSDRSNAVGIVKALSQGTSMDVPESAFPSVKDCPPTGTNLELTRLRGSEHYPRAQGDETLVVQTSLSYSLMKDRKNDVYQQESEMNRRTDMMLSAPQNPPIYKSIALQEEKLDLFESSMTMPIPWHVQQKLVESLTVESTASISQAKRSHALLQLAIAHYLGFGVTRDQTTFLELLHTASFHDGTALALLTPLNNALGQSIGRQPRAPEQLAMMEVELQSVPPPEYFGARVRYYQQQKAQVINESTCRFKGHRINPHNFHHIARISRDSGPDVRCIEVQSAEGRRLTQPLLVHLASIGEVEGLQKAMEVHVWDPRVVRDALNNAFKYGQFEIAKYLASTLSTLLPTEAGPCPFHWLIMFPPVQACAMLDLLLCRCRGGLNSQFGDQLNYMPSGASHVVYYPEHCLELFGTPLHWAVRVRNFVLVEALLDHDALLDQRWEAPRQYAGDVKLPQQLWTSAVDLAVQYHMPEIVDLLLSRNAITVGGNPLHAEHSIVSMIGMKGLPLSRYVVHQQFYREALRDTLQVLVEKHGHDVNWQDSNGFTPLLIALVNVDHEPYIIDELMHAGACADLCTIDGEDAAQLIASTGALRSMQTVTLELVIPKVKDINSVTRSASGGVGVNALHTCAFSGNEDVARALLRAKDIIIDCETTYGATALHIAAEYGHCGLVGLLLTSGADMSLTDRRGYTALELAVAHRKVDAAIRLLDAGASTSFRIERGIPISTVLHTATCGPTMQSSILSILLDRSSKLRDPENLNCYDLQGFTPLQKAAYYGDVAGVQKLTFYGADICKKNFALIGTVFSALQLAERNQSKIEQNGLKDLHVIALMIKKGPDGIERYRQRLEEIVRILRQAEATQAVCTKSPS